MQVIPGKGVGQRAFKIDSAYHSFTPPHRHRQSTARMKVLAIVVQIKIVLKNRLAGLDHVLQRLLVPPTLWCCSAILVENQFT